MTALTPSESTPAVLNHLVGDLDRLSGTLVERILASEYAYVETTLLDRAELARACRDNLAGLLAALAATDAEIDCSQASAVGRLKADRGVPLPALLHAFRLAGRLISEEIQTRTGPEDMALVPEVAARTWTVIDEFSSAAVEGYAEASAARARADGQVRQFSVRALLWGQVQDHTTRSEHLQVLRLPERGRFFAVCAERMGGAGPTIDQRQQGLLSHGVASHWTPDIRGDVGLIHVDDPIRDSRMVAALEGLAGGRIGLSAPFTEMPLAPQARREAELAMGCSAPGATVLVRYGERPTALLLGHTPDGAAEIARGVLGPVLELSAEERDGLLETLDHWFACDGSAAAVAQRQHFHRNTIHQRLRRIERLTGRACSKPAHAAELYLALEAIRLGHV